jgi:hypothetical protein
VNFHQNFFVFATSWHLVLEGFFPENFGLLFKNFKFFIKTKFNVFSLDLSAFSANFGALSTKRSFTRVKI